MALGLQTLQSLYQAGVSPQPPVVMAWRPRERELEDNFLAVNITMPKIDLPPFDEGFPDAEERSDGPFDVSSTAGWGPFGKVGRGGEDIWLESYSNFPGKKHKHHGNHGNGYKRRNGKKNRRSDGGSGHGHGGGGKGKGLKIKDDKGESIWLESSSNFPSSSSSSGGGGGGGPYKKRRSGYGSGSSSSSDGGYWGKPDGKGGCYCSIGRSAKGEDAALITLGSIGIPLAIVGSVLGGALGSGAFNNILNTALTGIDNIVGGRSLDEWQTDLPVFLRSLEGKAQDLGKSVQNSLIVTLWKLISGAFGRSGCANFESRDLGNDLEFIDENEIVLRMLDDLMMTYKYGYVPKCTRSHICKLNRAAATGGQPQSTLVPLMSLPAAWLLGKPSSNVMDFLHAVWLGRNEKDCDEVYPECTDIYSNLRFKSSGSNATDADDAHMDALLNDLRYLEENNRSPPEDKDHDNGVELHVLT